ncbi:MAG: YHYH protein [Flavobacteriaceae bacterium]|jgi:hypothetical protein|nr:YHYH protein [Flavobacteriaceae bacterium]MBT6127592.1 YHYH protein [Flavobacteriaceae bacterium]
MNSIYNFTAFLMLILLVSCSKNTDTEETNNSSDVGDEQIPEVYNKIYAASKIYMDGEYVVVEVSGAPDHKSPYYASNHELYEAYSGSNQDYKKNPNSISSFDFVFKIPSNPKEASSKTPTPLGSIGVALNGVSFFNQYAGPNNQPLTNEINSFDQYGGHPTGQKVYHYHLEPYYLTTKQGDDALLGFLLDGFPVYGPVENGERVTNSDLDEYHGHSHQTDDYPDGIYHYHITDADPYINGNGYFGTPGTVTQ